MRLLLVTQTRGRSGRALQAKREIRADWIRVGRAANCEIHLPDPRVALSQGLIVNRDGPVYSEGEAGVVGRSSTTRKAVKSVRLRPGTSVDVGPYRFTALETPEGFDGAIAVELVRPAPEVASGIATRATRLTLAASGLPKRWASWGLLVALAVVFFLVPAGRVLDLPWKDAAGQGVFASDRFWNPGPVLLAHQPIEAKCEACHEVAFEHVKDRACLECHAVIGRHVDPALQPAALFEGSRCTSCHRDHKGVKPTHRDDDRFCVDCHRDIRAKAGGASSHNVADFALDHPAFRVTLPEGATLRRVRQGAGPLAEKSNLVFPHDLHLDAKGVRSPLQGRMKLACASCHQPDASRRSFEPVSMRRHCQECHRLEFEPAVTTREVPHGAPREATTVVREFYANLALNGVRDSFEKAFGVPGEGLLRRAGEPSQAERRVALELASRKAERVSAELFEVRVCKTCHEVARGERDGAPEWSVAAVRPHHRWMPQARFDHASHSSAKCADCHDVARSKRSSDVAMPAIATCRECHGGGRPVEKKLTSNCLLCHGFHATKHAWDPSFKPRGTTRVAEGAAGGR